jgi:hypothetical protein
MKPRLFLTLAGFCIIASSTILTLSRQSDPRPDIMVEKLEYSQQLLEAIILEDFPRAERLADQLALLAELSNWDVIRTPEYTRRSLVFSGAAGRLAEAAGDNDSDGVALGYVELTLQCFQCHKYLRGLPREENTSHISR